MTTLTTYPLRLPKSIKAAAEELSKADGTSLNQFVATAVVDKIAVLNTASFFEERASRARAAAQRAEPSVRERKGKPATPAPALRRAAKTKP